MYSNLMNFFIRHGNSNYLLGTFLKKDFIRLNELYARSII